MTPSAHATSDREPRLLRRLGYDLVDAGARGHFHICREGSAPRSTMRQTCSGSISRV